MYPWSPPLISTFPHLSYQVDRCHMQPTSLKNSPPSSQSMSHTAQEVSDPQGPNSNVTGGDDDVHMAANHPLPPSRNPSPCIESPGEVHVVECVPVGENKSEINGFITKSPPQQKQPDTGTTIVRQQEVIISPISSTSTSSLPTPRLIFTKATTSVGEGFVETEDEEDTSTNPSEVDEESTLDMPPKTAAERLAEKRRMKRFRFGFSTA